jgi:hypothetical protein
MNTCQTCELVARRDASAAHLWDSIYRTPYWDVAHSYDTALPGWLVLVARGHVIRDERHLNHHPVAFYRCAFWRYSYRMESLDYLKLERKAFTVSPLSKPSDEKDYCLSRIAYQRLEAIETMQQILYGYDPPAPRLKRVLAVAQCPSN